MVQSAKAVVCVGVRVSKGRIEAWRTLTASKSFTYHRVQFDVPAGPRTKRTVRIDVDYSELADLVRQLDRELKP